MSDISKEQLMNQIQKGIASSLQRFLDQQSKREKEFDAELARMQAMIDAEPKGSAVAKALTQGMKAEAEKRPDDSAQRREDAAFAMLAVCNKYRLPLQLKQSAQQVDQGSDRKRRMTKKEMLAAVDQVLAVMDREQYCRVSEIARRTGLGSDVVHSTVLRLKREKRIICNGSRGKAGGWRLA